MAYDVVIVGGGSAGCVAASRLSTDGGLQVALLEAGPDHPEPASLPPDVADASAPTLGHDWGLVAEPDANGRTIALPRGKLVGGCSATNSVFWVRGHPDDYDRWGRAGNPGWSYDELLPFFKALEHDADVDDEWHGQSGPVPVHRAGHADLDAVQAAFLDAAVAAGHQQVADHNRPRSVGAGPLPRNVRSSLRMSAALTHLAPARTRPNLTVRPSTMVDRVLISGTTAVGVVLADGEIIEAGRVVLAAGSYGTPLILMRTGVGPAADLAEHGIHVRLDLRGVGAALQDHPLVAVDLRTGPGHTGPRFQTLLTMRSRYADPHGAPDLHLFLAGPFDDGVATGAAPGPAGASFGIVTGLMSPTSRGRVGLRSAAPGDPPRIDPAHLRTASDVERLVEATREARRIARTRPLVDLVTGPELQPGAAVTAEQELASSIRQRVGSYHHPAGTCAMGHRPEDGAVVDATGSVHGLDGLWVVDASVMPRLPAANPNATVMAVADRLATWLVGADRGAQSSPSSALPTANR